MDDLLNNVKISMWPAVTYDFFLYIYEQMNKREKEERKTGKRLHI